MAWMQRLDTKAATWPKPVYWAYVALKWYLVVMGAFALIRLNLDRMGWWSLY